ncbi:TPA_asm: hypothetical protein GHD27_15420, partial [Listeria monocytogenes]|nr:hypothetical protein [Listeria monocytogenes]
TMRNGRFLTAKISESHKTENACSLSDILEEQVDEKYFLSQKHLERLMKAESLQTRLLPDTHTVNEKAHILKRQGKASK